VQQAPVGYKAPQPVEVYILNDHANNSIPPEIREQFQRDEQGRVLFFTAPPLNTATVANKDGRPLGHSARYLAKKAEWDAQRAAKRKARDMEAAERQEAAKRARTEAEEQLKNGIADLSIKALKTWEEQLAVATKKELETLLKGGQTMNGMLKWVDQLTEAQRIAIQRKLDRQERLAKEKALEKTPIRGMTVRLEEEF
jgi:chromatin structure-remodeling complex subunit RSC1/2